MGRSARERGYVLVTAAAFAFVLVGALGLVVDVGRMYLLKSELQSRVDAAALAAAVELDGTARGEERAREAARGMLGREGEVSFPGPEGRFVRVECRFVERMYLMGLFGSGSGTVSASAMAGQVAVGNQKPERCTLEDLRRRITQDSDRDSESYESYAAADFGNGRRVARCGGGAVFVRKDGTTERIGAFVEGSRRRGAVSEGIYVVRLVR